MYVDRPVCSRLGRFGSAYLMAVESSAVIANICYFRVSMEVDSALLAAVRKQVNDPDAEILSLEHRPLGGGLLDAVAGGEGLLLHRGQVKSSRGDQTFELVEKICRVLPEGLEPDSWLYWKREALAYQSGLLDDMPPGLTSPNCFGVAYTSLPSARIFLEAIVDNQPRWSSETHARVGEALGLFNGHHLGVPDMDRRSWMAIGRAHSWVALAAEAFGDFGVLRSDPMLSRWIGGSNVARTIGLWRELEVLRAALADLPRCFCHHDAFKRNILFRKSADAPLDPVAIDWAFAGYGVLGEDLAANIGASLQLLEIDAVDGPVIANAIYKGYLSGLRKSGWSGAESDVRLGFCATTAMTFALGAPGAWLPLLRAPNFSSMVETIVGAPSERFLDNLPVIQSFFLDFGEEALELARR